MEFKVIVYIVLGIGYFVYSAYKNIQEQNDKPTAPKTKPAASQPKPKTWLDETIENMQHEAEKAKQQTAKPAKIQSKKVQPSHAPKRDLIVHEIASTSPFVEGEYSGPTYERALTSEEILHNERMRASQTQVLEVVEDEHAISLNAREAFIGSIILERKY